MFTTSRFHRNLLPLAATALLSWALSSSCDDAQSTSSDASDAALEVAEDVAAETTADDVMVDSSPDASDDQTVADTVADESPELVVDITCAVGVAIHTIQGKVVDENGVGLAHARPQPCLRSQTDTLNCLRPDPTPASGEFSAVFSPACLNEITMRVMVPLSGRVTMYCGVDIPLDRHVVTITDPFVLHPTVAVPSLPPEGDVNQMRTIHYASGLEVDLTPAAMEFSGGVYEDLADFTISGDEPSLCFIDPANAPDHVFAFYPEANVDGPGFPVRIPNSDALGAGALVDLFVLGGLDCRTSDDVTVHEGEWFQYGSGTVSADGNTIESDAGSELPCFTWFGYKAR